MKNTTKRVWSILLTICMLMGLMTVPVFADEVITIITQPEDVKAEWGEEVTFTVEAEGENLTYIWENWSGFPMDPEEFEGIDTDTLTIKAATCFYNGMTFMCTISDGVGEVYSDPVTVTVAGHGEASEYLYDEKSHMEICEACGLNHNKNAHVNGNDTVCDVCGYSEEAEVKAPIVTDHPSYEYAKTGEDVQFFVKAYGVGLTYQWYRYDYINDIGTPLTDGADAVGTKTRKLTLKNVDCEKSNYSYVCIISNAAGNVTVEGNFSIEAYVEMKPYDAFNHEEICDACGESEGYYMHTDGNCDGVCDECAYAFEDEAPKLTAQPGHHEVENGHEELTYSVTATGEGLTYQWYSWGDALFDDEKFSGTDTATLTVKSIYDEENGIYDCNLEYGGLYCVIRNEHGAVQSSAGVYNVAHVIAHVEYWTDLYHENYCVCGNWVDDTKHVDADRNKVCDLCDFEMVDPFNDVTDNTAWYYEAAVYGKNAGFFKGEYGNFLPNDNITRGEIVTVLARIAFGQDYIDDLNDYEFEGLLADLAEEHGTTPVNFVDIEGKFYERHARILAALGIVNGYDANDFRGENDITREELAAVLVRFVALIGDHFPIIGEPVEAFNDADQISDWAVEVVEQARAMCIFMGDENVNFNPRSSATRSETAQTLYRIGMYEGILLYW